MKSKKFFSSVMLLAMVSLCLIGCKKENAKPNGSSDGVNGKKVPFLRVGHVGHDHHLALYLACLENKLFKEKYNTYLKPVKDREIYEIVDDGKVVGKIKMVRVGGGSKMTASMKAGSIDIGLGGVAAVAKFANNGAPFKIICPLQTDGDMLVMKTGSPIKTWTEFVKAAKAIKPGDKPIVIGFKAPAAVAKIVFINALKHEGITYSQKKGDKVQVYLHNQNGGKKMVPALKSGMIDGFVMNQPAVSVAVNKKFGHVVAELRDLEPKKENANHPCCCICTTEKQIKENPAAIKAFLKIIILSTELIKSDPELAITAACKWTNRKNRKIEEDSIPTIAYHGEPTKKWYQGMEHWMVMMKKDGKFGGKKSKFKDMTPKQFVNAICDMKLCEDAAKELREKKFIK